MECDFYIQDMAIARKALADSKLGYSAAGSPLLCEVYCYTSVGHPSFYLQVYDGVCYTLLYARPVLKLHLGVTSVSCTFQEVLAADKHPPNKGDIYCGVRKLPKENPAMRMLLNCLPEKDEIIPLPALMIDGVTTLICNHCHEKPSSLLYQNVKDIQKNTYSSEQLDFLDKLFLAVPL